MVSADVQLDALGALSRHRPTEHVRLHGGTVTIIRLAHYAIHTSDLEASRRFYTDIWTPPALQAASSLLDSGSDCKQYIRPLDASVDAGPDDIRSQEPH